MSIPYIYHPVLFQIGPITIYTWGLIATLAFLASYFLLIKTSKLQRYYTENIFFIILLSSIIGSRILYLIEYPPKELFDIIKVWEGGLSLFGGIILAIIASLIYVRKHKLNFMQYANSFTLPLTLGLIIGRIGCLIGDGGHLGKITALPIGALVLGQLYHYIALYEIIIFSFIFIILLKVKRKFSFFLILYGISRFMLDFLRIDTTYFGLTFAQYLAIVTFILGLVLLKHR